MAGDKDFDEFLEIRRHIKRLQAGTPLLLRRVLENSQEDLQICTFFVTQDLQTLRWREQEGTGESHDVPVANIVAIEDESSGVEDSDEDHHYALTLQVRSKSKRTGAGLSKLGLICSSVEDLVSWRDGLKFLVAEPAAPRRTAEPAGGSDQDLRLQLQLQEELGERLQQENTMLREIVTRKDAIISEMQKSERCSKTESSSRESDEHLHDREVAILRRKNKKLQTELKGKQKTVKELLEMVGRLSQQQGAESSAQEEEATAVAAGTAAARVEEDDDDDEDEDDVAEDSLKALMSMRSGSAKASGVGTPSGSAKAFSAGTPSESMRAASAAMLAGRTAAWAAAGPALEPKARANGVEFAQAADDSEETGAFQEEMHALHQKLELLEKAAAAATQGMPSKFQPPARTGAGGQSLPSPTISKAAAQNGTSAFSAKSQSALEALAREMSMLEEKKRMVEHLARTLEPGGGDEDEDDGFPLR